MSRDLLIVGCGGFGRQVHDVVDAINAVAVAGECAPTWTVLGYLDDGPSEKDRQCVARRGSRILGTVESAGAYAGAGYVIGISSGSARQRLAGRLTAAGLRAQVLVHPSATCGFAVTMGPGTVVCDGARLMNEIDLGEHVHVNLNSTVGHDTVLADFCTLFPLVAVSGACRIGSRALLGAHSTVLPGVSVGDDAVVAAAACVLRDVACGTVVKGVPAA